MGKLEKYMKGRGLQVSVNSSFPHVASIGNELNNLFRLSGLSEEELDYLYSEGIIGTTKYDRILYQEALIALRVGGYFIPEISGMDDKVVKSEILLVGKGKFSCLGRAGNCLVFRKTRAYLAPSDDMGSWTFGIVTNGTRDQNLHRFIQSIEEQGIPNYEVLICGKITDKSLLKHRNTRLLDFDHHSEKGWITRKKNVICEKAKYENILIEHDRFYLDKGWYEGMKEYGSYFEVLCCEQEFGKYTLGWNVHGGRITSKIPEPDLIGHITVVDDLHPADWSTKIITHNGISIMKKSIWAVRPWNEDLFWGDDEDLEMSFKEYEKGIMMRYAPQPVIHVIESRTGLTRLKLRKNSKRDMWFVWDGPIGDQLFYRVYLVKQCILALVYLIFKKDLFNYRIKDIFKRVTSRS